MQRRNFIYSLCSLPLAPWLLAGCSTKAPLTIASHVWPGYELMFLARDEGWLDDQPVALVETSSATASMQLVAEGRVMGAALTLDEVLQMRSRGFALTVVLVFNISAGADMLLGRPGIMQLADLEGKRIGAENSALGALLMSKILAQANLTQDQVELVPLTIDQHLDAWQQGKVDALVTFAPTATTLLATGANQLFDSRAIPETILDVLAVAPGVMEDYHGPLRHLLAGHFRALDYYHLNPIDASYLMARRLGLSGSKVQDVFRGLLLPSVNSNRQLLNGSASRVHEVANELSAIMVGNGLIPELPSLNGLTSNLFLPRMG